MTPQIFNTVLTLSRGLPFVAVSSERASGFFLELMSRPKLTPSRPENSGIVTQLSSVEAREGIASGISATDRANTIAVLGEEHPLSRRLVRPGHIFPVLTRDGGTLVRAALPEAALDLTIQAKYSDAALFMDLLDTYGNFISGEDSEKLALEQSIPFFTLSEIVEYRLHREQIVERIAEASLPTRIGGEFRSVLFRSKVHGTEHVALIKGTLNPQTTILVRVQPEMLLRDVFGGGEPSSREQIHACLKAIADRGEGVLIYLQRPPIEAPANELSIRDERPSSMMREYGIGAQILQNLGVSRIELLSNATRKLSGLSMYGIEIVKYLPVPFTER